MNLRVWIKSNMADRVLLPLRRELIELIDEDASLLEVGCGTGDLLFQSAHKIRSGYGVDLDRQMIDYAESKRKENNLSNLCFACEDALKISPGQFDFATSTLCLHELPTQAACSLLKMMVDNARVVLVADYTQAKSRLARLGIECDELISGHYRHYRHYRKMGEIPAYAKQVGATVQREIESTIDGISIWRLVSTSMP